MLIAQITDCHIVEAGTLFNGRVDTAQMLRDAVNHINGLSPIPDVVLATGDLVNNGLESEYTLLKEILDNLQVPLLAIPGNHDDRAGLITAFDLEPLEERSSARLDLVDETWPVRLIGLDTTIPGEHGGEIVEDQMAWLNRTLNKRPKAPTLIFQHHPPFLTGIDWMDRVGLAYPEREAEVISRHPQIEGIVCGHIHRAVQTRFGGTVASTWPSTGAQVALALDNRDFSYVDEPAAVALHYWTRESGLRSHVSYIKAANPWFPDWGIKEPEK